MSSTVNYKAKEGDTVAKIATALRITPSEILALNEDLKADPKMIPNKTYLLPADAARNNMAAINDLAVEFEARRREAGRESGN